MIREYKDYVLDIADSIKKIEGFTAGINFEDFEKDEKTLFAVIRALEIIGEAAKKIPPIVKNKYKQIPWPQISGMRDKLIHEYFGINTQVIWKTVKEDIPAIKPLIDKIADEVK